MTGREMKTIGWFADKGQVVEKQKEREGKREKVKAESYAD